MISLKANLLLLATVAVGSLAIAGTAKTETKTTAPAQASAPAAAEVKSDLSTVEGSIAKIVEAKKEIYVQGKDKKYEFYFKPETTLTSAGQAADFASLKTGMNVRVSFKKVGKRTEPVQVEILQ